MESDLSFLLRQDQRRYVSLFLCFSKVYRLIFTLDTFGRQADEYIIREVMFLSFYVSMFAYGPGQH